MNFEFNKIAGAVLGTALGVMAVGIVADMIYAPPHHQEPGYVIAVAEPGDGGEGPAGPGPATPEVTPIADRLQVASADNGQKIANSKCTTCHTFEKGGPTKVGPNLWGVVGANVLHSPDFDYSDAMKAKGQEGMTWTFDNLDHFLDNPKGFIPGTQMAFPGLKKPDERADVIAYLRTLSDSPVPLPPPTPAPTAEAPPAETPATPPAESPPAPAPDHAAGPPADAAPSGHSDGAQPAPAPADAPPAESGGASSGDSAGAVPAPTEAAPAAEADSPEGAPAPDAPAEAPATEPPAQ